MTNVDLERIGHRALIESSNLLCEFVGNNLPEGYSIRLDMSRTESTLELILPDGEEFSAVDVDRGRSAIARLCEDAIEHDAREASETK